MVRSRFPRDLPLLAALAAVYFVAGKLGLKVAFLNASATAVWPCTGIALAAFLIDNTAYSFMLQGVNWKRPVNSAPCASSRIPQFKGGNRMESSAAKQQPTVGGPMIAAEQSYLRTELEQRRERLHAALRSPAADASLSQLLTAVDAALRRIDQGTFGLCETCHDTVEQERLLADPLVRFCLDHLTSA